MNVDELRTKDKALRFTNLFPPMMYYRMIREGGLGRSVGVSALWTIVSACATTICTVCPTETMHMVETRKGLHVYMPSSA